MSADASLAEIVRREARRLADDQNICAVGVGPKLRSGEIVAASCLQYYVLRKLDAAELAAGGVSPVPDAIDGWPTDVVEIGRPLPALAPSSIAVGARGTEIYEPVVGGAAITALGEPTPAPGGYGTLGCVALDNATGARVALSSGHVLGSVLNRDVAQPVFMTQLFGAQAAPVTQPGPPDRLIRSRVPEAVNDPVVLANAVAWARLVAGEDDAALSFGQTATQGSTSPTESEGVVTGAAAPVIPPAGRVATHEVGWAYERQTTTEVRTASTRVSRAVTPVLKARRVWTDQASYTGAQTIRPYVEIVAPTTSITAHDYLVVAHLFPLAGGPAVRRLLRPTAKQTKSLVLLDLKGFSAPAAGVAAFPISIDGFAIDGEQNGTFETHASLPAGRFALRLPAAPVRLFFPPSTKVTLEFEKPANAPAPQVTAFNMAGEAGGTVTTQTPQPGKLTVIVTAGELVEIRVTASSYRLLAMNFRRDSATSPAPLTYAGAVPAAGLVKGKWGVGVFVQVLADGAPASANVVEAPIGVAAFVVESTFDVTA